MQKHVFVSTVCHYSPQFMPTYISTLSIAPNWPLLSVVWPTFRIFHILEGVAIKFPDKIIINPLDANTIKHTLRDITFNCMSLLKCNTNFRLVDFQSANDLPSQAVFLGENAEINSRTHEERSSGLRAGNSKQKT